MHILSKKIIEVTFVNPTGGSIRMDNAGDGHHGAPRGSRLHDGVDFGYAAWKPDHPVVAPVTGRYVRPSLPYTNDPEWQGMFIVAPNIEIKMWYCVPIVKMGAVVEAGKIIATGQNIGEKYSGALPHVHLRITKCDPELIFPFPETAVDGGGG